MKILVADDDNVNLRVIQTFLEKWGWQVVVAKDGNEARTALLQEDAPAIAILDWMMPGVNGVDICREVRRTSQQAYTYLILLTAKFQKQDILEGFNAGADDYLTKPFDANELRARLHAGKRVLDMQDQLRKSHAEAQFRATHDIVTGLLNRAAILEAAQNEVARAKRNGTFIDFIMADLDHFKQVNDTYGHIAGDAVLHEAAQRMQNCLRPYDRVGRYGGEEFLMIVPGTDASAGGIVAERVRHSIAKEPVKTFEGEIAVTVSLGLAGSGAGSAVEVKELLRLADAALYHAKHLGRNRVEVASDLAPEVLPTTAPKS